MPIALSPFDWLLCKLMIIPDPLIDASLNWQIVRVIEAALNLGVVEVLVDGPRDAGQVAAILNLDVRGTALLLQVLRGCGYLHSNRDGCFTLTALSRKWLTSSSPSSLDVVLAASRNLRARWEGLEESIRSGGPKDDTYTYFASHAREGRTWYLALAALAEQIGPDIVHRVTFRTAPTTMLDLGGAHGVYSALFCRQHAGLHVTLFDYAEGVEVGRECVGKLGLAERFRFVTGDFWTDQLSGAYDVVLLFNIIHGYAESDNVRLLQKCRDAMAPRGRLILLDQVTGTIGTNLGNVFASLTALNLFNEMGSLAYTRVQIEAMLAASGLRPVKRFGLLRAPGSAVFVADLA